MDIGDNMTMCCLKPTCAQSNKRYHFEQEGCIRQNHGRLSIVEFVIALFFRVTLVPWTLVLP